MGKKKFDKNKGVTFKLVFRSEDDQANSDQTLSERIFSVIEADKKKADQENDKERQKILSQFTKEELGQAPAKKAKPHHGAIKASAPPTDAISSQTKGREDLWITHVMRMKEQAKLQAEAEEAEEAEEEERREALLKKAKQPVKKAAGKKEEEDEEWEDDEEGEDEEWEDEDEEDDEEAEEYEEIEEEDEEEEVEDIQLVKKKAADDDEEQGNKNVLEKIEDIGTEKKLEVTDEDFPELGAEGPSKPHRFIPESEKPKTKEQVLEEIAEEEIDLKKVNVKGAVRMKRYDDMGLPMDGYNYYQHVVDPNSGGAPSFSFTTTYDKVQKLEDTDLKKEKMNAEEKEVYEALEMEGEGGYEDLDDDFFNQLTKAEAVVVEEGNQAAKQEGKKVTFGDNEIKEILSTKDEQKKAAPAANAGKDGIYSRKDFQKVLKAQVEVLKEKYKEERQKNKAKYNMPDSDEEEEEEVEEVDESWDEDDEENRPQGYIERLKWEDDVAAQQCVAKSMSSIDSEEDEEERRTRASKAATTRATSEIFPQPVIRKAKLNIVKEETNTKNKTKKDGKDAENKEKEVKEEESDSEDEDDDEEEEKNKVEEVFKKREKGETKEEKKARKAAIKQFKQERKDKKKKFKENFEMKKKEHITIAHKQSTSLQGLSIYKLTV